MIRPSSSVSLKNASIPIVTIVGIELGTLLGGSVITETIFAWPGVGRLIVSAIFARDYPLVQAAVFVVAAMFVLVNLARFVKVDPEQALRKTNAKFRQRFGYIERRLAELGKSPAQSNIEEMEALWQEAKQAVTP